MHILTLFCEIDDFFLEYEAYVSSGTVFRGRQVLKPGGIRDRCIRVRELKTQTQVEHSRHRSVENFHVTVFSALIAYQLLEKKPTLNIHELQQTHDLQRLDIP